MAKEVQLKLAHRKDANYYVPSDLRYASEKQLKKELTRLRDILRKRINRLEEKGILYPEDIERFKKVNKRIADIHSTEQLKNAVSEISKALNVEATTIPKAKELAYKRKKMYEEAMESFKEFNKRYQEKKKQDRKDKYEDARQRVNFSPEIGERQWWAFVDYTKNVMNDNVFYWSERKKKYLHDNKIVIDKINHWQFNEAIYEIDFQERNTKNEGQEDIDSEEWEEEFRKFWEDQ